MTTPKTFFIFSTFLCLSFSLKAQDKLNIKFGKVSLSDFDLKTSLIDSNTNAVVVADVGTSEFVANTTDLTFSLVFNKKKRIKIINQNGLDAASVIIPLYVSSDGKEEKLEGLKAVSYNIENGKVNETSLNKSDIFSEKHNKHWVYKKFTFPAARAGSILEYSFQVRSDFYFNFQSWRFQGEYPVLWSQYNANIPEFFQYVILSQGYHPFYISKTDNIQANFAFSQQVDRGGQGFKAVNAGTQMFNVTGLTDYHTWVMKDVPALKLEPFTTTLNNAIAKIEFQLNQVKFPNSMPHFYMNSWEKVSTELLEDEKFGVPIERANNWLEGTIKNIVSNATTPKGKVKLVYEFVRDNFTCNEKNSMEITTSLKDVFNSKTGSAADINMLLIAMLRTVKINADPVILSTRSNGYTHEIYPLIDRFNYIIAKVHIDDSNFYLDATIPRLPFGILPTEVYNGQARVITKNQATPVYFIADSLKEESSTWVFINNADKGGVEGYYKWNPGVYESLLLRNKLSKSTLVEYEKTLKDNYTDDITIENIQVDSLKLIDEPITVKYDLNLKSFGEADIVYFNPLMGEALKKNPFVAAQRFYPVEMPYTSNISYTLNMEVPKGYKVDELPKSARVNYQETEGMFEYLISNEGDMIQMRCRLIIRKANFTNEDYQSLRDFYSYIIKKEAEQIVFKKIK